MSRLVVIAVTVALLAIPAASSSASAATPRCDGLRATIVGTNGPDTIKGTPRRDVIVSKGGADKIFGRGGNDVICTGSGRDTIVAGAGRDRVFAGAGKDRLKGGAGWDILDGGPDKDACYTGADGGKLKNCEEADLRVTATSPASVVDGETIRFTVRVKNTGSKPASYDLALKQVVTGAECTNDYSGTYPGSKLQPRQWVEVWNEQSCEITGANPLVTMTATAQTTALDDDPSNNEDEAETQITPAP